MSPKNPLITFEGWNGGDQFSGTYSVRREVRLVTTPRTAEVPRSAINIKLLNQGFQGAHLWPLQWGGNEIKKLFLAHSIINKSLQEKVHNVVNRAVVSLTPYGYRVFVTVENVRFPEKNLLDRVTYKIDIVNSATLELMTLGEITINQNLSIDQRTRLGRGEEVAIDIHKIAIPEGSDPVRIIDNIELIVARNTDLNDSQRGLLNRTPHGPKKVNDRVAQGKKKNTVDKPTRIVSEKTNTSEVLPRGKGKPPSGASPLIPNVPQAVTVSGVIVKRVPFLSLSIRPSLRIAAGFILPPIHPGAILLESIILITTLLFELQYQKKRSEEIDKAIRKIKPLIDKVFEEMIYVEEKKWIDRWDSRKSNGFLYFIPSIQLTELRFDQTYYAMQNMYDQLKSGDRDLFKAQIISRESFFKTRKPTLKHDGKLIPGEYSNPTNEDQRKKLHLFRIPYGEPVLTPFELLLNTINSILENLHNIKEINLDAIDSERYYGLIITLLYMSFIFSRHRDIEIVNGKKIEEVSKYYAKWLLKPKSNSEYLNWAIQKLSYDKQKETNLAKQIEPKLAAQARVAALRRMLILADRIPDNISKLLVATSREDSDGQTKHLDHAVYYSNKLRLDIRRARNIPVKMYEYAIEPDEKNNLLDLIDLIMNLNQMYRNTQSKAK